MTQPYTSAGLSRLYQAVKKQAEDEFLAALLRDYPYLRENQVEAIMRHYRATCETAELRLIADMETTIIQGDRDQSRGKI